MTDTNKPAEIPAAAPSAAKVPTSPVVPAKPLTIEGKPVDSKAVDAKPVDAKPVDAKPASPPPMPPQATRPGPPPKPPVDALSAKPAQPPRGTGTPVWLTAAVFVVLAAGLYWVWQDRAQVAFPTIQALQNDLGAAQQRIATLEQRPVPAGPDTTRIVALENAVKALANKPADTSALEQRLATLESRPAPDVAHDVQTAIAGANAELAAKMASLDSKVQQDLARATRLRAATAALDAGKPMGDLAGAPAAVQRYATAAPPTEPALRQSFASFAIAAEKASQPTGEGQDFAARMWGRAQQLVTVRQGDKVLVGAPAAVTLAAARTKLDAGDLAGAVAALTPLDPPGAAAMAPWKRDAQFLLDARAGIAAMATKS